MKAVLISDLHIGADEFKHEQELLEFLDYCKELDCLYIVGDAMDLWRDSFPNLAKRYKNIFDKLSQIKKVVYCAGNHDYLMRKFVGKWNNIEIYYPDLTVDMDGYKVYLTHGHLQALEWKKLFGFKLMNWYLKIGDTDIAPAIGDFWYKKWVQKVIHKFMKSTSGRNDKTVEYLRQEGLKLAKEKHVDFFIAGHSHQVDLTIEHKIVYANCGTWIGKTDYLLWNNGSLQVKSWK